MHKKHLLHIVFLSLFLISGALATRHDGSTMEDQRAYKKHCTQMPIIKQDPSVDGQATRPFIVPTKVFKGSGPYNQYVKIMQNKARPSAKDQFVYTAGTKKADSVSVFATVWSTMLMYRQDLDYLLREYPYNTAVQEAVRRWDDTGMGRVEIYPHSGEDANAYFTRYQDKGNNFRELHFFSFEGDYGLVHTCQSFDVVAHESGHEILDRLRPEYYEDDSAQLGGLHESFGDTTAMFAILNQLDMCEAIYNETMGDLHKKSMLSVLAEEFGLGFNMTHGLRYMDDDIHMDKVEKEVHEMSRVFTGAIYDIFVDAFDEAFAKTHHTNSGALTLHLVSTHLRRLLLQTYVELDVVSPKFSDVAWKMSDIAIHQPQSMGAMAILNWPAYIKTHFESRGIPVEKNSTKLNKFSLAKFDFSKRICGTAKHCGKRNV